MTPSEKLYYRLARLQPNKGDPPTLRLLLSRAEIALILPALKAHYGVSEYLGVPENG